MSMIDNENRKIQMLERRINNALNILINYGMIEGESHKQWCIDQVARCLLSGDGYQGFKDEWEGKYGYKDGKRKQWGKKWDEGEEPIMEQGS